MSANEWRSQNDNMNTMDARVYYKHWINRVKEGSK